jgi:hypothetical protein
MSHSVVVRAACLLALAAPVLTVHGASEARTRCPPRLPGPHAGFQRVGPVPSAHWTLYGMRLFDAIADGKAPVELAPDSTHENWGVSTEVWRLTGGEPLLIVCVYDGSGTYYRTLPDPAPTRCISHNDNGLLQAWCE